MRPGPDRGAAATGRLDCLGCLLLQPSYRRRHRPCCRPCPPAGGPKTAATGSWTWLSGRMKAVSPPAEPPTTCRSGGGWPSTCRGARPPPRRASRPSASRPAGTMATCSTSCQFGIRLPWPHGRAHPHRAIPFPILLMTPAGVTWLYRDVPHHVSFGFQTTRGNLHASRNLRRRPGTRLGQGCLFCVRP